MAISYSSVSAFTQVPTYTTLQALTLEYLDRSDEGTANMVPLFINFAEKAILRGFRIPAMEVTKAFKWGEYTSDSGKQDGWMYIPGDYLEMIDFWEDGGNIVNRVPYSDLLRHDRVESASNKANNENPTTTDTYDQGCASKDPSFGAGHGHGFIYARTGMRWYVRPIPVEEDVFYLTYYQDPCELSVDTDSTYLLELAPDAVLYQSVAEGYRYLLEEDKAQLYEGMAAQRIGAIMSQVEAAEYSGGVMQIHQPI